MPYNFKTGTWTPGAELHAFDGEGRLRIRPDRLGDYSGPRTRAELHKMFGAAKMWWQNSGRKSVANHVLTRKLGENDLPSGIMQAKEWNDLNLREREWLTICVCGHFYGDGRYLLRDEGFKAPTSGEIAMERLKSGGVPENGGQAALRILGSR